MAQRFRLDFHGAAVERDLRAAAARGLLLAAEHVLAESQEVVPLDEGPLQNSGTASVNEGDLAAAVSYDTPYAVRQHEELDYRHAPGRTAKYLERPLNAERQQVQALIAAQMRRALR
ncbi:minor capsid protein [Streptomyces sp. ME01-18h]|uniref:minor capsid protein n=1 Tax=Streptomyces sp. ME01-18h TaxID=462920 RepID=UPI0029A3CB7B|nr:minor capsid protein [Streptomyces sp. ME01-18h]MDX3398447.1 minor capsid protein [Streptomyces sp. ME01-18h]